jgi:hypothetical protein
MAGALASRAASSAPSRGLTEAQLAESTTEGRGLAGMPDTSDLRESCVSLHDQTAPRTWSPCWMIQPS